MSADLLDRATRALRETTESSPADLERVLGRVNRQKPPARLSMRHFRIAAWTLAGSLLGVGAWANVTGRVHWFAPAPESAPLPAPAATEPRAPSAPRARRRSAEPAPEAPPPEAPSPQTLPLAPEPAAPSAAPAPRSEKPKPPKRPAPLATEPPRAPPATTPDSDVLYRAAHEAHFARGDHAAALALWDRYLAAAEPGHRWKVEARYNRGIALYRLGEIELAREALEPFARGEYGGYRRAEALRLLEALSLPEAPHRSN